MSSTRAFPGAPVMPVSFYPDPGPDRSTVHPPSDQFYRMARALAAQTPVRVDDPDRVRAAVALIHAASVSGPVILVIRRSVREGDPWSGQMALPGGRFDPHDGSLLDTAVRETREETGVVLDKSDCIGELSDLAPTTSMLPAISVRPFVFALAERPEVSLNPEADRFIWVPLKTLRTSLARVPVEVRGHQLMVDAFLVEGEVIWGMTQRIIMPFLDLVNI